MAHGRTLLAVQEGPLEDVAVNWLAPRGTPGILSVTFETASGAVTI